MSTPSERAGAESASSQPPEVRPPSGTSRWLCPLLFGLTLACLAWILIDSFPSEKARPKGDDAYYLGYMQTVATNGLSALPGLVEQWNTTPRDSIFPPPSRVGFIVTAAVWGKIFGTTYRSLQTLSLASFLLLCILNYLFARRHFGEPRALFIGALVGFSPLLMGLSRLALSDSFVALWMTSAVWLYLEVLEDPACRRKRLLFMAVVTGMVLVKEIAVLLVAPFLAFLLYERFGRGIPHDLRRFALCFASPGVVVVSILILAAGGFGPLWETVTIVLGSPASNRYAIRFGSGPWFRVILDFLLLSPWPTLLAIGWFWITASRLRSGRYDRESVYLAFLMATLLLVFSFFTKNVRYAAVLDVPVRVFAVLLVCDLCQGPRVVRTGLVSGGVVAILCWLDWNNFDLIWVQHEGYDPITRFLGLVRKVIP